MMSKDIWKEDYSVGMLDNINGIIYFYCNKLKILPSTSIKQDFDDYLWDMNPDYMSCMNYIIALKVFNYLKYHKMDCFGCSLIGLQLVLLKWTPNDTDCFKIIF